jgi:uroporphyrinogen-III decarboxylase
MVNRFECVLSAILHEEPPVVPQTIDFINDMARAKFMPLLEKTTIKKTRLASSDDVSARLDHVLREAELLDNFVIGAGNGGFRVKNTVKVDQKWQLNEWETGAAWRTGTAENMWVREYVKYPVQCREDLDNLVLPDPDDPERYKGLKKAVEYVRERGFFPQCSINGFFSGVWYFLRGPLYVILKDIYADRVLFEKLVSKVGEFNLQAERNLWERGALMITWVDDLGYNKGTFMNPQLYEDLIYPWHKKAIELAHKHGAFVNMHSHGNINAIMPLLVEAGLDVLNPIGPSDNMDLAALKHEYVDRLCLLGGLSKHIGFMSVEELKEHVADRIRKGSLGGGFMLGSEGSLPYEMTEENFLAFIRISQKYRRLKPSS